MAIARLRGDQLKKFDIPLSCIATLDEEDDTPARYAYVDDDFVVSVCKLILTHYHTCQVLKIPKEVFRWDNV